LTQILLHPQVLPRYASGPMIMPEPWAWWETRCGISRFLPSGDMLYLERSADESEVKLTFGLDAAAVILTDPPASHLLSVTIFDDRVYAELGRTLLENMYLLARVVWHEQPDPRWNVVPGLRTCCPGDYRNNSEARGSTERSRARDPLREYAEQFISRDTPLLRWPIVPTIRDERGLCEFCGAVADGHRHGGYRRVSTAWSVNEIREREGLPELPGIVGASGTRLPGFEDRLLPAADGLYSWGGDLVAGLQGHYSAAARYGPAIKPEQEVVDEIDRLVNEQIRPGPRDDYSVNRYPKCTVCRHEWHGLDCDADGCDCINTDWLKAP